MRIPGGGGCSSPAKDATKAWRRGTKKTWLACVGRRRRQYEIWESSELQKHTHQSRGTGALLCSLAQPAASGVQLARMLGSRHLGHASTRAAPTACSLLGCSAVGTSATRPRAQPGSVISARPRRGRGAESGGRLGASPAARPPRSGRQRSRSKSEAASCVLRRGLGGSGSAGRSLAWGWAAAGRRRAKCGQWPSFRSLLG